MAVGIVEVDAVRIPFASVNFDAGIRERGLNPFVVTRVEFERHVIDFTASVDVLSAVHFEERDALLAALEKTLPRTFVIDFHAEKVDVKLSGAGEILDVENHMIDAGNF